MDIKHFSDELKKVPMTGGFVAQIRILENRYGDEYINLAEALLKIFDQLGLDAVKTARKYIYDYLRQLDYFLKNKEYGHNDYGEIRQKIYDNKETMLQTYMPGLLLSYAYTTILYEKNHLFINSFLTRIEEDMQGIEVGFGEGFYLWEALNRCPKIKITGFDISLHAIEFASKFLSVAGIEKERYDLKYGNVFEGLEQGSETMDFATIAEVIEHIPHPEDGIKEVVRTLKKGGLLYLTTVIDSNHMDHISNFDSPEVVEELIESQGMRILEKKVYHMTDDFPESKDISVGLAFVAEKN